MVSTKNSMFVFWLYRCRATFWEAGLSIIVPAFWENYRTIGLVDETYRGLSDLIRLQKNYWLPSSAMTIPYIIRTPTFPLSSVQPYICDIFSTIEIFRILCLQLICRQKKTGKHLILLYITCISRDNVCRVQIQKEIISYFNLWQPFLVKRSFNFTIQHMPQ